MIRQAAASFRRWRRGPSSLAFGLLLPALAIVGLLLLFPLYLIVNLSLRDGRGFDLNTLLQLDIGFEQFKRVVADPSTFETLKVSIIYTTGSVALALGLGLGTAVLLNKRFPGRRVFRTLLLLPWPVPGVVAAVAFMWLLDGSSGIINSGLQSAGFIEEYIPWFFQPNTALAAVIMPTAWVIYPLVTLMLLASLQTIPSELYESAQVDGATPTRQFRHITWPAIRSQVLLAGVLIGLWTFRSFDYIYVITKGGPAGATETFAIGVYNQAFRFFNLPYAAALGILAILLAAIVVGALFPKIRRTFF